MVTGPRLRLGSVACVKEEKEEELNPLCGAPQCRQTQHQVRSAGTGRVGQQDLVVRGLCVRGVDGIASKGLGAGVTRGEGEPRPPGPTRSTGRSSAIRPPPSSSEHPRFAVATYRASRALTKTSFFFLALPAPRHPRSAQGWVSAQHFRGNVAQKIIEREVLPFALRTSTHQLRYNF